MARDDRDPAQLAERIASGRPDSDSRPLTTREAKALAAWLKGAEYDRKR